MSQRNEKKPGREGRMEYLCHLIGWWLFVGCALFFVASAAENGDWLALTGSLLFLVACFVFLAPLLLFRTESPESPTDRT